MECPLAIDEGADVLVQCPLAIDEGADPIRHGTKSLLKFKVLLAQAKVELGQPTLLKPVPLSEEPDHLLAGFAGRKAAEPREERGL
jgi:hypothetical protein